MKTLIIALLVCMNIALSAQYQIGLIPRVSPDRSLSEVVGYTKIDIAYGSPKTNGRAIFGDLVPYGEVWRAGANNATTIELSHDVLINDEPLAAGEYGFFVIPRKDADWTIIFNSNSKQWGSFRYADSTDVLRIDVAATPNTHVESLRYSMEAVNTETANLFLEWAQARLALTIQVDNLKIISELVEERVAKQSVNTSWVVYLQGAEYLVGQERHIDQALNWLNTSEELYEEVKEWRKEYYPQEYVLAHLYWVKARALALQEDVAEAKVYVEKLKGLGDVADQFLDLELIDSW